MKIRSASWCIGVVLLMGTLTAAEGGALTQVGPWLSLGSPAHDLVIRDNFAYVVTDLGLKIVDLGPPSAPAPVIRGSINNLGGKSFGIAINGSYVYVANQIKDLQIINVANPDLPVLVATKTLPGYSWDVAVKDDSATGGKVIAYVASYSGELYVIDVTNPLSPQQIKVLGLPVWSTKSADNANLLKLNSYVTAGNAKDTGVTVAGNHLMTVDWNSGRLYYYDVTQAHNPIFAGTHYMPFTLRVDIDLLSPGGPTAYALAAYGYSSGIYSVRLADLAPSKSTYHATCANCGFFAAPPTDYGGLGLTATGKYVMYIAGKTPEVQVIDVTDPIHMVDAGSIAIPPHRARTAQSMGVAQYGNHVIAVGAALGLGVFHLHGLSN